MLIVLLLGFRNVGHFHTKAILSLNIFGSTSVCNTRQALALPAWRPLPQLRPTSRGGTTSVRTVSDTGPSRALPLAQLLPTPHSPLRHSPSLAHHSPGPCLLKTVSPRTGRARAATSHCSFLQRILSLTRCRSVQMTLQYIIQVQLYTCRRGRSFSKCTDC